MVFADLVRCACLVPSAGNAFSLGKVPRCKSTGATEYTLHSSVGRGEGEGANSFNVR